MPTEAGGEVLREREVRRVEVDPRQPGGVELSRLRSRARGDGRGVAAA
jgi:hypothetical protein